MLWQNNLERFGHYARINHVPGPVGGTFRQVYQEMPLPGAGASRFIYATREIPIQSLFGAGYPTLGPPSPVGRGAMNTHAQFWLAAVQPKLTGQFQTQPLLPPINAKPGS